MLPGVTGQFRDRSPRRAQHDSLFHHAPRAALIVLAHLEPERRLRHAERVLVARLEDDLVALSRLGVAEETVVDDKTRVDVLRDSTVRKGVAMDLSSAAEGSRGKINCLRLWRTSSGDMPARARDVLWRTGW